jgi:hypothetical protein
MPNLDAESAALCNSISRRLTQFARRVGPGNTTPDKYKRVLETHQPTGGMWNSPSLGPHESAARWPCRQIVRLDKADTHPTNIRSAVRWLDVVGGMRDMLGATHPQMRRDGLESRSGRPTCRSRCGPTDHGGR